MAKILIVEDEPMINEMLSDILTSNDYEVDVAHDGQVGIEKFEQGKYDLIITDVMMPKLDGYELTKKIRASNNTIPILMLTAKSEYEDELQGFEYGVTEFVSKPFSLQILLHRIKLQLHKTVKEEKNELEDQYLKIDLRDYQVYKGNEQVELTLKEFNVLKYLMTNANQVLSREQIIAAIWEDSNYIELRVVDNHIKNLRRKLQISHIKTVTGIGYRYEI